MPSWTPQKTWGTEIVTDSDLNTYIRDDMEYLKAIADTLGHSGATCHRSTTQSIPDSTWTPVVFDVEDDDVGGWIAVSSSTFTTPAGAIPSGYTYIVHDCRYIVSWAANSTGVRKVRMTQNGSGFATTSLSAASADTTDHVAAWKVKSAATTTWTLEVYQSSGGALNVTSAAMSVDRYRAHS